MKTKQIISCILISATIVACVQAPRNQTNNSDIVNKPTDIEVPQGFDWKTTQDISLEGNIDDKYDGRYEYRVNIYAENPVANPKALLIKGVSTKSTVSIDVTIPKGLKTIYVCQIDPLSRELVQAAEIVENKAVFDFSAKSTSQNLKMKGKAGQVVSTVNIPATTGEAIAISGSAKTKLETGSNYVIAKGSVFNGDLNFPDEGNVTLFVEGEWIIGKKNLTLQKGTNIIVQGTGVIKSDEEAKMNVIHNASLQVAFGGKIEATDIDIHLTNTDASIIVLGDVSVGGVHYNNLGKLINQGTLKINDELKSSNGTVIVNDGTIIASDLDFIGGHITNNGTMDIGKFEMNSNKSLFVNNSMLLIKESVDIQNTIFENNCYVELQDGAEFDIKGSTVNVGNNAYLSCYDIDIFNSKINLGVESMFEVRNIMNTQNKTEINGAGKTKSLARLNTVVAKNWEAIIYNNVQVETAKHTENGQWNTIYVLNENASMVAWGESSVYITANECTGKGNNPDQGTGGEGDQDDDIIYDQVYTYLLEDNWPKLGDYDMNDAVIELTSYKESLKNKSIVFNFKLINVGASKELGAGIQLDNITTSQINKVVSSLGGTLENNQKNVVIPLFANGHALLGVPEGKPSNNAIAKDISIEVVFNSVEDVKAFKISSMNLFITTSDNVNIGRRKEIHLCGYAPTDKAETAIFGKEDDNSFDMFYKSKSNYVWGLMVPVKFAYPKESINISIAYPDFGDWISSGGTQNQNWYEKPNDSHIAK